MSFLFPERFKIVTASPVGTTNGGIVCDYISLKNAHRVVIIAELFQDVAHATALGYNEATAVAPTGAQTGTAVMPVWKNPDVSATDTLVRGSDAATIAATASATNQLLVMELLPEKLTSGYDCIAATLSDSSQATNFATVTYLIETRYAQATPPSAITD